MQVSINNLSSYIVPARPILNSARISKEDKSPQQYHANIVLSNSDDIRLNGKIFSILNEISNLENNWDEEESIAPNAKTLSFARSLVYTIGKRGQQIYHTAPGPNGEIMLDLRNATKTKSLEIILYKNRSVVVSFPESGTPFQKLFIVDDLPDLLNWLSQK